MAPTQQSPGGGEWTESGPVQHLSQHWLGLQRRKQGQVVVALLADAKLQISRSRLCEKSRHPFIGQDAPGAAGLPPATAWCQGPRVLITINEMGRSLKDLNVLPYVNHMVQTGASFLSNKCANKPKN